LVVVVGVAVVLDADVILDATAVFAYVDESIAASLDISDIAWNSVFNWESMVTPVPFPF
jgi:hypothetical protein